MKTTVELPDRLLRRARAFAASRGITLRQLLTEALEQQLDRREPPGKARWRSLAGELASLSAETARIDRRIADEFEQVDEEDAP